MIPGGSEKLEFRDDQPLGHRVALIPQPVMIGSLLDNDTLYATAFRDTNEDPDGLFVVCGKNLRFFRIRLRFFHRDLTDIVSGNTKGMQPVSKLPWNMAYRVQPRQKHDVAQIDVRSIHEDRLLYSTSNLTVTLVGFRYNQPINSGIALAEIPFVKDKTHISILFLALGASVKSIRYFTRAMTPAGHWYPEFNDMMVNIIKKPCKCFSIVICFAGKGANHLSHQGSPDCHDVLREPYAD